MRGAILIGTRVAKYAWEESGLVRERANRQFMNRYSHYWRNRGPAFTRRHLFKNDIPVDKRDLTPPDFTGAKMGVVNLLLTKWKSLKVKDKTHVEENSDNDWCKDREECKNSAAKQFHRYGYAFLAACFCAFALTGCLLAMFSDLGTPSLVISGIFLFLVFGVCLDICCPNHQIGRLYVRALFLFAAIGLVVPSLVFMVYYPTMTSMTIGGNGVFSLPALVVALLIVPLCALGFVATTRLSIGRKVKFLSARKYKSFLVQSYTVAFLSVLILYAGVSFIVFLLNRLPSAKGIANHMHYHIHGGRIPRLFSISATWLEEAARGGSIAILCGTVAALGVGLPLIALGHCLRRKS